MNEESALLLPRNGVPAGRAVHELVKEVKAIVDSKFQTSMPQSLLGLPDINVTVVEPIITLWRSRREPAAVFAWLSARCDYLKGIIRLSTNFYNFLILMNTTTKAKKNSHEYSCYRVV
jgi:hypothetical protein